MKFQRGSNPVTTQVTTLSAVVHIFEARKDLAIAKLGKIRPDIVTTDLIPAPVDGFAVIQGVKNNDLNIPVIVISGTLNQRKRWVAHRLGATVCLAKPIRPDRLLDLLDELTLSCHCRGHLLRTRVMQTVIIHTDGGCSGNPGPGGWAAILRSGEQVRELSGSESGTTNNRDGATRRD